MKKSKKEKFPRFKVWVEIERLLPNGDEDPTWELRGKPAPDCVGKANTLKEAERIQFMVATAFGVDPENSDCRPRVPKTLEDKVNARIKGLCEALKGKMLPTKKCPACKRPIATCACIPVGDPQDGTSGQDHKSYSDDQDRKNYGS